MKKPCIPKNGMFLYLFSKKLFRYLFRSSRWSLSRFWGSSMVSALAQYALIGLRPLLGQINCKFEISCTRYAILQLQEKNFFKAVWFIIKRLLACNPFNRNVY